MSSSQGVRQPDGTICRKGASCKRHGLSATISRQLKEAQTNATKVDAAKPASAFSHPLLKDGSHVRKGLNTEESKHILEKLHQDSDDLEASLDVSARNFLHRYKSDAFRYVNNYLIGGPKYIASVYLRRKKSKISEDLLAAQAKNAEKAIPVMDSIFKKYEEEHPNQEQRVLYRSFRVLPPEGKKKTSAADIDSYVNQTYKVGDKITNKAYTSTSLDSDFILVDTQYDPEQIIVHEIVSSKGIPIFSRYGPENKSIQNAEKEILLPRESSFRIVNVTEATYRSSYKNYYDAPFMSRGNPRRSKKFTVIQMVEE